MTNQEILEKAIRKAIDGGFIAPPYKVPGYVKHAIDNDTVPLIIYDHDFAKAL